MHTANEGNIQVGELRLGNKVVISTFYIRLDSLFSEYFPKKLEKNPSPTQASVFFLLLEAIKQKYSSLAPLSILEFISNT